MTSIIGFAVVPICVIGGFLIAGGSVGTLLQPAEFIVIGGAALGGVLIATPIATLKQLMGEIIGIFKGDMGPDRETYLQVLLALNELFQIARKDGIIALESHVNEPEKSKVFEKYPKILHNHHAIAYICDTIKLFLAGSVPAHEIEMLMDAEIDSHHQEASIPSSIVAKVADSLPGLGIVAAVLGIIITMGSIDGDPAEVGHHVAAALVGTFLGVLLAYGFFSPMAGNLENRVRNEGQLLHVIKAGIAAFAKGMAPSVAVEFARRSIFQADRPSFDETEKMLKDAKKK